MKTAYMILDLQFGSTGKGLLAGYLAKERKPDTIVTAWGPNAGHTYIDSDGREFIHRMLGNGIVSPALERVLIGPGSVIDADILYDEVFCCKDLLKGKKIIIHPNAAIVLPKHAVTEKSMLSIGSTMKGTGAAIIQRIRRDPYDMNTAASCFPSYILEDIKDMGIDISVSDCNYKKEMEQAHLIQIEGAQGYSLSIYHGFYPYCTSRDVTPAQVLADCAIPYWIKPEVYGTLRTYPIRVANRYMRGVMIGTSGPCYPDQNELSWEELDMEPELTTVTKLPRRVFSFSQMQTKEAIDQCGPSKLFLNFANYMEDYASLKQLMYNIQLNGIPITWIGLGPGHDDIVMSPAKAEKIMGAWKDEK